MTSLFLNVRNLSKQFPRGGNLVGSLFPARRIIHAVNNVSFTIGRQETLGLVSESGGGNSTIRKLIARLVAPTSGAVTLDGQHWLRQHGRQLRQRRRNV